MTNKESSVIDFGNYYRRKYGVYPESIHQSTLLGAEVSVGALKTFLATGWFGSPLLPLMRAGDVELALVLEKKAGKMLQDSFGEFHDRAITTHFVHDNIIRRTVKVKEMRGQVDPYIRRYPEVACFFGYGRIYKVTLGMTDVTKQRRGVIQFPNNSIK